MSNLDDMSDAELLENLMDTFSVMIANFRPRGLDFLLGVLQEQGWEPRAIECLRAMWEMNL